MYQILKLIHVAAVIIFLGNIITGLFWKAHADRTKDIRIIAHTMHGIIRSDRWFTIPGVIVITLAGVLAAIQAGLPILRTGWIFWSLVAFSVSGIVFAGALRRCRNRFSRSPQIRPTLRSTVICIDRSLFRGKYGDWWPLS